MRVNEHDLTRAGGGSRIIAAMLMALLLSVVALLAPVAPAHAAGRVDLSATPNADGSTTVTLTGSGFQYLPNAPGGVYVFFGAVSDPHTNAWAPSQGGQSGSTYSYANTPGSTLLIAFQGGSSADAANGIIDANGAWTAQMTIPGSRFSGTSGNPHAGQTQQGAEIDCLAVQCGIITIGAHGNVNSNNESFSPVGFVTASGAVQSGTGGQSFTDEATVIDLPSSQTATPETPEATEEDEAQTAAPRANEAQADDAAATGEAEQQSDGVSIAVVAALGVAVLAVIAAVIALIVRRSRDRAPSAPGSDAGSAQTKREGEDE